MAINLGDAILYFKGDTTGLDASTAKLGDLSRNIGLGFTAMGTAITGGLGFALKAFADSESAGLQLDAVLKSTGSSAGVTKDSIMALATELQKTTLFEDDAVVAADALLLTFTSIGKEVFPQATRTMLDMSQALGQDLQSSAIQLGKALNDPIQGMTALRRVGVSFTEEQIAQVKVMQESGNIMGAQKLILAELTKEFGGSAVMAAQGLAGEWMHLKNSFGDLMEEIGGALSGGKGLSGLIDMIKNAVTATTEWIKANPELAATLVKVAAVGGVIMLALGPVLVVLPGIVAAVGLVGGAFAGLAAGPVVAVIAALAGIVVAGYEVVTNWDTIKKTLSDWTGPVSATKEATGEMSGMWYSLGESMGWAFTHPVEVIQGAIRAIVDTITAAVLLILVPIYAVEKALYDMVAYAASVLGLGFFAGMNPSGGTTAGQEAIPARASGGPVMGGQPYLVGEEGPELFIPSASGAIVNAQQTAAMGSSATINVSFPSLTIREDADIERISKLIARQIPMALTGALA